MEKSQLPALNDLYSDQDLAIKNNDLNILLNQPPAEKWIKEHPFIKGLKYIPIERIEWLLTSIFTKWWVEIIESKLIGNSVALTIRLFVLDPITGETLHQDGIGASPLQTDKDAGAIEFNRLKSGAVMMAAPAAESYAIKDAAEKFGKLFGKDISRKDQINYANLEQKFDEVIDGSTIAYISKLLNGSSLDEDQRTMIENELGSMLKSRAKAVIDNLLMNQLDPITQGNSYQQGDITKKLKDNE